VSAFSAKWLSLREPYDLAARNPAVLKAVADAFRGHAGIVLVDLACGAGATRRAIGAHLPERQTWRLVDNDLGLLGQAATVRPMSDFLRGRWISCAISSWRSKGRSIS